ncbi:hypothetical protein JO84_gp303 [Aureococcus anophagefferens virus]|uniref:Uncharacterized protein n=1 Tax=Aureococcus anophagefferens virus TaxID=1474867 RepID=A0A076FG23_9VIRU|nr:hypothetical protein JO84_gp303 [Aureococcus anophagefferens virus]AII17224.1 hypothetical protein AaV_172 [Aureococcus anophagefferens virus]UOG94087.1 hypothetical protein MKD35_46 [Aureococcus anophagefferens virus]
MFDTECLVKAATIALENEKQISFDYFEASSNKECKIVKNEEDKLLYKSNEEYTSPLVAMYKFSTNIILETQNTVYIVSSNMF